MLFRFRTFEVHAISTSFQIEIGATVDDSAGLVPPGSDPVMTPQYLLHLMRERIKYYGTPLPDGYVPPPGKRRQMGRASAGRAPTLAHAIRAHSGEAARSEAMFEKLKREQRECLEAFLNSLAAPRSLE